MASTTDSPTTDRITITEHETEQIERANASTATPVDSGWREVAETALAFVKLHVEAGATT